MNSKSKGTTLIEIMVSVVLISIVMIFIFNILVDIKAENELASKRSTDSLNRASFTRIIQNDFISNELNGVDTCNKQNSILCLKFLFNNDSSKELIVFDDFIVYDNEKWTLTTGKYLKDEIKITYKLATQDESKIKKNENYHFFELIVPVSKDVSSNRKYDLELTHISKDRLEIDCNIIRDISPQHPECEIIQQY